LLLGSRNSGRDGVKPHMVVAFAPVLLMTACVHEALGQQSKPVPVRHGAINPPACAVELVNAMWSLTRVGRSIEQATTICAYELGWTGATAWGNKEVWPFHNRVVCAEIVIGILADAALAVGDLEGQAFACWNNNQACGKAIAEAAHSILQAAQTLVSISKRCQPTGAVAPYFSNKDSPITGFRCWARTLWVMQRLIRAAKFIDTACDSCPGPAKDAVDAVKAALDPEPDAAAGLAAAPEPEHEPDASALAPRPLPTSEPAAPEALAAAAPAAALGSSSWANLMQPEPFAPEMTAEAAASERRLLLL